MQYHWRRTQIKLEQIAKVKEFVVWKLKKRVICKTGQRKPMDLKYLYIAKAVNLSYMQVRRAMDYLTETRIIEKWRAWETLPDGTIVKKNYYRLPV